MAGRVGVLLHDRLKELRWLSEDASNDGGYELTPAGTKAIAALGIDVEATRRLLDWSERRPHVGGALGAALLKMALKRRWVMQDLDSRALDVTKDGRSEMLARFGLQV